MVALCFMLVLALAACSGGGGGGKDAAPPANNGGGEAAAPSGGGDEPADFGIAGANIAFVIPSDDKNAINDRGWIEGTWTGVKGFAEANGKTCTWYIPLDNSAQGYYDAMVTAISSGTEIIVSLGSQGLEGTVMAANDFPDTYFIPVENNGIEPDVTPNMYAILHQSDEAGFLAGIAAVKGGFKNIGLFTGMDIPPINIWVMGYLQGINYQAGMDGITDIQVRQHYANALAATPEAQALAASWYEDGCDLIIPMAAGANVSLFAAADAAQKSCFGADVDQGPQSEMILTCAIKKLWETVPKAVSTVYDGTFKGGTYKWETVDDDAVGLATGTWRMDKFGYTVAEYEADFEAFRNNVNNQRSSILTEPQVRKDQNADLFDQLWDALPAKNVTFNNIK